MTNDNQIIEGEFTERAVARVEAQPASATVFGTDDPMAIMQRVVAIATPLAEFVRARGMVKHLDRRNQSREYVQIEGWSFMGAMLGIAPIAREVKELRDPEGALVGFEARVELVTRDGAVVGGGIGECSWAEANWSGRDPYAVKSMAQTRATGKAYRLALGFVMSAAGFEATPAEEMPDESEPRPVSGERAIRAVQPPRPRDRAESPPVASGGTPERMCKVHATEVLQQSKATKKWGHVLPDGTACVEGE